jgi:hypothetical protein
MNVSPSRIRPQLAAKEYEPKITQRHLDEDKYLLIQPKIDGMRVLFDDGVARSRSWLPWTQEALQAFARDHADLSHGWDCEGTPGHIYDTEVFRRAQSEMRAADGNKQLTLWLFDNYDRSWAHYPYEARLSACIEDLCKGLEEEEEILTCHKIYGKWDTPQVRFTTKEYDLLVKICPTFKVSTLQEIEAWEQQMFAAGWEGSMLKRRNRGYKWNRATTLEGNNTKLKRFKSGEAVIIGYEPWFQNQNELQTSALGYAKRTSHQENLAPIDRLGAWECMMLRYSEIIELQKLGSDEYMDYIWARAQDSDRVKFRIGVFRGYSHSDRDQMWVERDSYLGRFAKFEDQDYSGGYDKPRTPVLVGFRDLIDL